LLIAAALLWIVAAREDRCAVCVAETEWREARKAVDASEVARAAASGSVSSIGGLVLGVALEGGGEVVVGAVDDGGGMEVEGFVEGGRERVWDWVVEGVAEDIGEWDGEW
jgi:hypothetical protein